MLLLIMNVEINFPKSLSSWKLYEEKEKEKGQIHDYTSRLLNLLYSKTKNLKKKKNLMM